MKRISFNDKEKELISKKRVLEICKGLLTFLIFYFSSYLQIIPVMLFNIDVNNYSTSDLALANTFVDLLLVIVLILLYFKELKKEFKIENITDDSFIKDIITKVIENNSESVNDYKSGHDRALKYLMGQVMKEAKGSVNPKKASDMLKDALNK